MLAFAFTRNDRRAAGYFAMFVGSLLFYVLGYLLEITAVEPAEAMLALRIENIGIPLIPAFFLLTALAFFRPKLLRPWMTVAALLYGAVAFLVVFLNDEHMLHYTSITMIDHGSFYVAKLGKGPLFIMRQLISLAFILLGYGLLVTRYVHGSKKLRRQMMLFFIGSAFAFGISITPMLRIVPYGLDPSPLGLTIGLIFFAVDLYQHKLMDIAPAAFDMTVESMDDALIVLDNEWCFVYCNQHAYELFPTLKAFSGTEEVVNIEGWPKDISRHADEPLEFSLNDPATGKPLLQRASVEIIHSKRGKAIGFSIVLRDITEITAMLNRLEAQAITDPLTGVYNRRYFMSLVERQMRMVQRYQLPMGIMLFDIDFFKRVNDTYGHLAGDHTLCRIVDAVSRQLRAEDAMARYGGEEFIILSVERDAQGLLAFAERLRDIIEHTVIEYEGATLQVTASFGAALIFPGHTYETAIEAVDKALYAAKNGGRNRVALGIVGE